MANTLELDPQIIAQAGMIVGKRIRMRLLWVLSWLLLASIVIGQTSPFDNYEIINLTVDDGLPSNELYNLVEDSRGYIWIASDRGLVRFDGYGFKTYGFADGLGDISCLLVEIDKEDRVWIMTYSRRFYIFDTKTSTFSLFEHQDLVDQYLAQGTETTDFHISNQGKLYISISAVGMVSFSADGIVEVDKPCDDINTSIFTSALVDSKLLSTYTKSESSVEQQIEHNCKTYPFGNCRKSQISKGGISKFHYINQDTTVLTIAGCRYFFENGELAELQNGSPNILSILSVEGGLLTLQFNKLGATWYRNYAALKAREGVSILSNTSTATALRSKDGLLLITSLDQGLFIFRKQEVANLTDKVAPVTSVHLTSDSTIAYVSNRQNLKLKTLTSGIIKKIYKTDKIYDIAADMANDTMVVAAAPVCVSIANDEVRTIAMRDDAILPSVIGKKVIVLEQEWWLISYISFFRYSSLAPLPTYKSLDHFTALKIETIAPYHDSAYLIGCPDGLYHFWLTDRAPLWSLHPQFSRRINDIILYQGKYYIATLGGGIVMWDGDEQFEEITNKDGLVSDNIEKLRLQGNKLLACTFSGLSVIEIDRNHNRTIRNYTTSNGLPSNQVFDAGALDDKLYVGTGAGLIAIPDRIVNRVAVQPTIEQVNDLNSREDLEAQTSTLPYDQNDVKIVFRTIAIDRLGDIQYRYRLNNSEWTTTTSTTVIYNDLLPNRYLFEVQASYGDDLWSTSLRYNIHIKPPWWQTLVFKVLAVLLLLSLVAFIFLRSIRRIKEKNRISEEIRSLEKAALQAQMNPHFIFNCLNSIQAFIMDNDKDKAMDYLSQFAQLIRGTLVASTQSTISLAEEIAVLNNYLSLEQLRMDNRFTYTVTSKPSINQTTTIIPPMLIEPFVENAVLHGMQTRKSDGKITVSFDSDGKDLVVTVTDNGRKGNASIKRKSHKSLGTKITKRRLAHINQISEDQVQLTTDYTAEGTTVRLKIKAEVALKY